MAPVFAVTVVTSTRAAVAVSGAASVVVEAPQPAAMTDEPRMMTAANWGKLRFMTGRSSRHLGARNSFFSTLARHESRDHAGLQARDGRVEHVARERVVVLAR